MSAESVEVVEEVAPQRGKKRLLVIGVLLVVLLGGGAAGWFLLLAPDAEAIEASPEEGTILTLEPLTTTLGQSGLRHARVGIAVVLADGVDPLPITEKQALLKDALLREVATMDADRLRSAEGSEQLRSQLSRDARAIWGDDVVLRVVLTELLVQ